MRSLVRWKFVDRTWEPDDLELFAKFWLRLYEQADHPPDESWESHQTLELHLTGFPRSVTQPVADELARRLSEAGVPVDVSSPDGDTLVAKAKPREGNQPPLLGRGIQALAGAPFDGMVVEIRYTVADAGATEWAPKLVGATLVVVGQLRGGAVAVKSVWVDPAFMRYEGCWGTPPEWEDHILAFFDHYRSRDKVKRVFARDLFNHLLQKPPRGLAAAFRRGWRWLVDVPLGRPRLGGLILRVVILVATFALIVTAFVLGLEFQVRILIMPSFISFFLLGNAVLQFANNEIYRLFNVYTQTRAYWAA